MNKKEALALVREALRPILEEEGYKYVSWAKEFHLKKGDFTFQIGWACVDRWQEHEIGFFMAIRSERVSEIFNTFARIDPKYHRESFNLSLPFVYFTGGQLNNNVSITVSDFTQKEDIVNAFSSVYKEKVKPFFEAHSSLKTLSDFILNNIDVNTDCSSPCMNSIILLKLISSPLFEDKVIEYKKILSGYSQWQQDDFNNLVNYLESI